MSRIPRKLAFVVPLFAFPGLLGTALPIASDTGSQPAETSTVALYAWPANDALSEMTVGEELPLELVSTDVRASAREITVRLPERADLRRYAATTGDVNLILSVTTGRELSEQNIGLDKAEVDEVNRSRVLKVPTQTRITVDDSDGLAPRFACAILKEKELGDRWVNVASLFSRNTGTRQTYLYSKGQSTKFDAGASPTGADSGFEVSGSTSVSSTGSIDFGWHKGPDAKHLQTMFAYARFRKHCPTPKGPVIKTSAHVRAYDWSGEGNTVKATTPSAKHCVSYKKGQTHIQDVGSHRRMTATITILGMSLGSENNWSDHGVQRIKFKTKKGLVCGVAGKPGGSGVKQLVAK